MQSTVVGAERAGDLQRVQDIQLGVLCGKSSLESGPQLDKVGQVAGYFFERGCAGVSPLGTA